MPPEELTEELTDTELADQESGEPAALTDDDLLEMYRVMVLSRTLDERVWLLNRQGKAAIVASAQGHEAAQIGAVRATPSASMVKMKSVCISGRKFRCPCVPCMNPRPEKPPDPKAIFDWMI